MNIIKIIKTPTVDKCTINTDDYPYFINDFIKTMEDKNLTNFYNNLSSLQIKEVDTSEFKIKNSQAEYDIYSNTIFYSHNNLNESIMHELLHVSSRIEHKDRILTGFMQVVSNGYGLGEGLNEGYTSLMDDRYFIDYDPKKKETNYYIYPTVKYICNILDLLIGKDTMEEYYLTANLYNLCKTLSIFSSDEKTYRFILDTDYIFRIADRQSKNDTRGLMIVYQRIIYYLSECFLTKFKILHSTNEISDEEYKECIKFTKWLLDNQIVAHRIIKSRKLGIHFNKLDKQVTDKLNKSRVN